MEGGRDLNKIRLELPQNKYKIIIKVEQSKAKQSKQSKRQRIVTVSGLLNENDQTFLFQYGGQYGVITLLMRTYSKHLHHKQTRIKGNEKSATSHKDFYQIHCWESFNGFYHRFIFRYLLHFDKGWQYLLVCAWFLFFSFLWLLSIIFLSN